MQMGNFLNLMMELGGPNDFCGFTKPQSFWGNPLKVILSTESEPELVFMKHLSWCQNLGLMICWHLLTYITSSTLISVISQFTAWQFSKKLWLAISATFNKWVCTRTHSHNRNVEHVGVKCLAQSKSRTHSLPFTFLRTFKKSFGITGLLCNRSATVYSLYCVFDLFAGMHV